MFKYSPPASLSQEMDWIQYQKSLFSEYQKWNYIRNNKDIPKIQKAL